MKLPYMGVPPSFPRKQIAIFFGEKYKQFSQKGDTS